MILQLLGKQGAQYSFVLCFHLKMCFRLLQIDVKSL